MSQTKGPRGTAWETILCKSFIGYFGLGPYSNSDFFVLTLLIGLAASLGGRCGFAKT